MGWLSGESRVINKVGCSTMVTAYVSEQPVAGQVSKVTLLFYIPSVAREPFSRFSSPVGVPPPVDMIPFEVSILREAISRMTLRESKLDMPI